MAPANNGDAAPAQALGGGKPSAAPGRHAGLQDVPFPPRLYAVERADGREDGVMVCKGPAGPARWVHVKGKNTADDGGAPGGVGAATTDAATPRPMLRKRQQSDIAAGGADAETQAAKAVRRTGLEPAFLDG